jgi:hypothetical protein
MKALRLNWYLPVLLFFCVLVSSAFTITHRNERINGSGNIKEEARNEGAFKAISTSGAYNIYIQPGNQHSIKIEADDNILPYIVTKVSGNNLEIYTKKGYDIKPSKVVNIYITMEELEQLASSGSGGFYSRGKLKGDNVRLSFSGSVNTDIDLNANALKVEVSGSSKLSLKGNVSATEYHISGSVQVEALELKSNNAEVAISGSGKLDLNVEKKMEVRVSGMGQVRYKGTPVINQSSSGSVRVTKID